ncbi:MAG: hypothetical protein NC489_08760 [Ruminococcus flavefaciens]|nr:hypothetical protein [Ruminococcus flavefaciens]
MAKKARKKVPLTKGPAGIPPVKKMIDLTKDKTDPKASKFNTEVEKLFTRSVMKLNIPACSMLATNPRLLSGYMMGRTRYMQFMGDCSALVDQCLRDALAKTILDQMVVPELNKVVYPGKWDEFNLFALARSRVNIIVPLDKPELGGYLTCKPVEPGSMYTTEQMEEEGNALSFLRMSEYNPNRLYQFGILTASVIVKIISTAVESDLPLAYLSTAEERLVVRYGREMVEVCRPIIQEWAHDTLGRTDKTFDAKMNDLGGKLYTPAINYCAALLFQSGIDDKLVEKVVSPDVTELKITHISDQVSDIATSNAMIQYRFNPVNKEIRRFGTNEIYPGITQLTLNMGQLYRVAQTENPKKSELADIGKAVRGFLDMMIMHTFNMYLAGALFIEEEKKDPDTSEPKPEFTMQENESSDGEDAGSQEE